MKTVSRKTISRALLYIRTLEGLVKEKHEVISSGQLATITGLTDVQIRKDISSFGKVGTPRLGYNTGELLNVLERFLLQNHTVHVALFGAGNLGTAILRYPGFYTNRIKLVAAFDKEEAKIGKKINDVTIYALKHAPEIIKKTKATIGIIAVPQAAAQEVAECMVKSGLRGIVNFSPVSIEVPKYVTIKDIDLTIEFLSLFCTMSN